MRLVLLTKAFPAANALFNRLDAVVPVARVIAEGFRPPETDLSLRIRQRARGLRGRLDDPFRRERRLQRAALRAVFSDTVELERDPPILHVPHRGWDRAIADLASDPPDVLVVFGTSLIPEALFSLARIATLNVHAGLAPYYRGVHSTEAAIINDDLDNIGVTIHQVAANIDRGDIVAQGRPKISAVDDEFTLENKVLLLGHKLVTEVVARLAEGGVLDPVAQEGSGLLITRESFTASHRRLVRELVTGGIIDRYLVRRSRGIGREKPIVAGVRVRPRAESPTG